MNNEIKNKTLPKLRFPEFKNAGEWQETTLIQLASFRRGSFPQPYGQPEWYDGINGMPFIQVYDVGDNFLLKPKTKSKISKLGAKQSVFIPKGTVIVTIQGSIGRVAITQYDAYIDRTLLLFEQFFKPINKVFFAYALFLLFEIEKLKAPGGIIKTITKEVLSNFQLNVPSVEEQQKIADCLSSLDELISAQNQKLQALKTHKKGLMQQLFPAEGETVPKLRFAEFEDSGDWVEEKLDNVAVFLKGKGISKSDVSLNGNLPCIRYGELYTYYSEIINSVISFTNLPPDELVLSKANDVIIPSSGETREDIATASCVMSGGIALGGDLNIIRTEINGVFLSYYLSHGKKNSIAKLAQGDAVVHLYSSQLKKLTINFPKFKKEQQKIADCLSSLDEQISALIEKIEALKINKKGLMQQLFPQLNGGANE